jgi:hypothetical protein
VIKADLHIHTAYSMDSVSGLEQVIEHCRKIGINCLAIADHNTISGALKMQEIAPFQIIVAEEILTSGGEVIGLFLKKEISAKLPIEETIARIKEQNGLVCIPHPYDTLRFSAFRNQLLESIIPQIDIIEVFNARSLFPGGSDKAKLLAQKHNKLASAGSDAHIASEVGRAYVEMPDFNGKDEFLTALAKGKIFGRRSSPAVHFASTWARLKKRFF